MPKELVISAAPHETRVAILEDGQLCEIYIEREKEFALVGSIYKGRVTRVLPGMQSAFVEIGLDSDAFLYVGDFLENLEDYDHVVTTVEGKVEKMEQQGGTVFAEPPAAESPAAEVSAAGDVFPVEVPPSPESEPSPGNDFNTPEPHAFRPAGQQPPRAAGPFVRQGERPQGRAPGSYGRGQGSGPGQDRAKAMTGVATAEDGAVAAVGAVAVGARANPVKVRAAICRPRNTHLRVRTFRVPTNRPVKRPAKCSNPSSSPVSL